MIVPRNKSNLHIYKIILFVFKVLKSTCWESAVILSLFGQIDQKIKYALKQYKFLERIIIVLTLDKNK